MKGEWMGVNWLSSNVQIHQNHKEKNSKNRRKKEETRKENETAACTKGRTAVRGKGNGRASHHHGSWCAPRAARGGVYLAQSRRSSNAAFLCLLVLRFGPQVLPILGHFEPPLQVSLIHMALNFTLSPIIGLDSSKSAIKTQTSQNKRN